MENKENKDFPFRAQSEDKYCEPVINPATNKSVAYCKFTDYNDVDSICKQAKIAQRLWLDVPSLEKTKRFNKLIESLNSDIDFLSELECINTGKPIWQAKDDINGCIDTIVFYSGLTSLVSGFHKPSEGSYSFTYSRKEPFGVCGGIGAWNYPLQMAIFKSIPALVAGNSFVFKPSPLTPFTCVRLQQHFESSGFVKGLFSCVFGDIETGQNLVNNSMISKISFTGSVRGGSAVLKSCADHIRPTTLELGGKSPLIIMPDCNIDASINGTLLANFLTQGQVCSNAARVFVHKDIYDQFKEKLVSRVKKMTLGEPFDENVDLGALICQRQTDIVLSYVESAVKEGAKILCGGQRPQSVPEDLSEINYILPCVLDNCHDDMKAVKEEIFGPVITLLKFENEEEVIERANNIKTGLAGGVFSENISTAHRIAARLECGAVYVNCFNVYPPGVPFGGSKMSGFGRENAIETIYAYTQTKSVYFESGHVGDPFPSASKQ